ncbi:hypothetical protein RCH17_000688 [Arthrobacter sp. MP_M7]|nr:hypothetical protein [Arthrobacter sp. MP_M4]MEC5201903.1 hypothetical protein [Arthrobacter sp. MP_M7]
MGGREDLSAMPASPIAAMRVAHLLAVGQEQLNLFGSPGHRPAVINHKTRDAQTLAWSQRGISVGH